MAHVYVTRRHGSRLVVNALLQPGPSAAMTSLICGTASPAPISFAAPLPTETPATVHRRWSHYAASSSTSATHRSISYSATVAASPAHSAASATHRTSHDAKVDGSVGLPPGAALRRAVRPHDSLDPKGSHTPPWQDASEERLSKELQEYRKDLLLTKAATVCLKKIQK